MSVAKTEITMRQKNFDFLLKRIGCGLTQLRTRKGYDTIKEFAHDHRLPFIQYWRIEKGKANITFKTLVTVLSIHSLSVDEFFTFIKNYC